MSSYPKYSKMASGNYSLILEDGINYFNFPKSAKKWTDILSLKVIKKIDGAGERLWECEKEEGKFFIVYDDWFPQISLEPQDQKASELIFAIGDSIGAIRTEME